MDISLKRFSVLFVGVRLQDTDVYLSVANVVRENHIIFTRYYTYIHSADIRCRPPTNRRHYRVTIGNSRPADGHKSIVGRGITPQTAAASSLLYTYCFKSAFPKIVVVPETPNALWVGRVSITRAEAPVVCSYSATSEVSKVTLTHVVRSMIRTHCASASAFYFFSKGKGGVSDVRRRE